MSERSECCGSGESNDEAIRAVIKEKYGRLAREVQASCSVSCCGSGVAKDPMTRDLYAEAEISEIPAQALLASLGCANPVALANLSPGEVVLDLGSGGGIDVLLSAKRVGPTGKAYGLDMTDEMIELARKNQAEAGIQNVEFLKGEIENIPLPDCSVDVIISNCVINLSADKDRVFREAIRVLRPGGRFAVADIVLRGELPEPVKRHLELWAGCIAGALEESEYKNKLIQAGFVDVNIQVVREYTMEDAACFLPAEVIAEIDRQELSDLSSRIVSAFVRARKPGGC